jgi:hypothetical protein
MANQRPPSNDYSGCPLTVSLPAIGFHFVLSRRQCSFLEESEVRRSIAATPHRPQRVESVNSLAITICEPRNTVGDAK